MDPDLLLRQAAMARAFELHIGERLLREADGPMLSSGIQGFHGAAIGRPRRPQDQPDPDRLAIRFEDFLAA